MRLFELGLAAVVTAGALLPTQMSNGNYMTTGSPSQYSGTGHIDSSGTSTMWTSQWGTNTLTWDSGTNKYKIFDGSTQVGWLTAEVNGSGYHVILTNMQGHNDATQEWVPD